MSEKRYKRPRPKIRFVTEDDRKTMVQFCIKKHVIVRFEQAVKDMGLDRNDLIETMMLDISRQIQK